MLLGIRALGKNEILNAEKLSLHHQEFCFSPAFTGFQRFHRFGAAIMVPAP